MADVKHLSSNDVVKMFPVSFERTKTKKEEDKDKVIPVHDRLISEENLVDWFRGVTGDSCDLNKNSPYSYVVTDEIKNSTTTFRFILAGYHLEVELSGIDTLVKDIDSGVIDIYALLTEEGETGNFRHVNNGDSSNIENEFLAVQFLRLTSGNQPDEREYPKSTYYRLHILTYNSKHTDGKTPKYTIPPESRRYSFTVDGGVV